MLIKYLLYSLITLVINLSACLGIAYFLYKYRKLNPPLAFSISFLLFLAIFLFYNLSLFYLGIFNRITIIAPLVLLLPFALKFIKFIDKEIKILILLFLSHFLIGILLQTLIPYYPIGGDWFSHYQKSSEYLTGEITFVSSRPPVFNFLGSVYLKIFSDNFWVFQIISVFLSSLLVIPVYLIAKIFNKKSAIITIIFIILNLFVLQNTVYTWAKNLTAFFVFFFFYFIIKNQSLSASIPGLLAIYTSPIGLFYIPAGYIYGYLKKNKNLFKSLSIIIVLFLPFVVHSVLTTGAPNTSPFLLYTIAVNGVERLVTDPTSETFENFLNTPLYYIIGIRIINFIMTMFPTLLFLKFTSLFINLPIIEIQKTVIVNQIPIMYHFLHSIPGALSTLVYIFSMTGLYRLLKKDRSMFLLILVPLILGIIYWGWIKAGLINDLFHPTIPLLIMVAVSQMKSRNMIYIALFVMLLEGIIFSYFYISSVDTFIKTTMDQQILSVDSINRLLSNDI